MKKESKTDYLIRNRILKLLSDEETARVSNAETATPLARGDEFIDLMQIDKGVQRAGDRTPTGSLLPKKAVQEATWTKIMAKLT